MKIFVALVVAALFLTPAIGWSESLEAYPADGLSQALIESQYARIAPSICLLTYSIEITNPNTGQVSQRDANALGLIVSSKGLVLAHGHMQLENRKAVSGGAFTQARRD